MMMFSSIVPEWAKPALSLEGFLILIAIAILLSPVVVWLIKRENGGIE